jgi:hypothetical protein
VTPQKIHIKATALIPRWGAVTSSGERADSNNPAHQFHVIGITDGQIESGAWGDVTVVGDVFDVTWTWTSGATIYLNSVGLSETPPGAGFVQIIGWALTPQSILVNIR